MPDRSVHEQLAQGFNGLQRKLYGPLLRDVGEEFARRQRQRARASRSQQRRLRRQFGQKAVMEEDRRNAEQSQRRELLEFLVISIEQLMERLQVLQRQDAEFRSLFANAPSQNERQRLILEFARNLGATPRQLRGDARAFDRWFGDDAVNDRYARRKGAAEQKLVFCLNRLAMCVAATLESISDADAAASAWNRLALEKLMRSVMQYRGDARVEVAAIQCLTKAVDALPPGMAEEVIGSQMRSQVERAAINATLDSSVQCAALELLSRISPNQLFKVLDVRLRQHGETDEVFVHRCCVRLLGERVVAQAELIDLVSVAATNPSAFVRQQLASTVLRLPDDAAVYWMHQLAIEDCDPKVRAAALLAALDAVPGRRLAECHVKLLLKVFADETDLFVLRTAFYVAAEYCPVAQTAEHAGAGSVSERAEIETLVATYQAEVLPAVRRLQCHAARLPVRRWAAQAAEQIRVRLDDVAGRLFETLRRRLAGLGAGRSRWISRRSLGTGDEELIGRVLAVMAQEDHGYDLQRSWWGYRITRGPVFRIRLWRLLHELFTPAPDKRQAFRHTIGRVSEATIRAPSQILAELSETKVPGEPLLIQEEGGWRPYLPLPDDFLSTIYVGFGKKRPVRYFTSEGITTVQPPRSLVGNAAAYCRLTWHFARYARSRNWREGDTAGPHAYLQQFTELGFRISFRPYEDAAEPDNPETDASVTRFFPLICPMMLGLVLPLKEYLLEFANYFGSLFENSVSQLLVFIVVALSVILSYHFYANWTLRRARQALGLTIGGWGTRGKSGTERLKAALFNALGCGVVSKSSGCEAMFMVANPFGELRELLLYRPADKATIWEHRDVLRLAARMNATVFLWECMGLTPSYVEVLQQQWSCDDLSTITNAYPDHEDLQGPAGWNVADVISGFAPRHARLLTSEQQMLPRLRDACREMDTSVKSVGWLESGLLTDDVLQRFPYREHPDNIALVLALADELGFERDAALKEMADRLVPDLGVLKTYPTASVRGRQLEFTNGMSANERFACLGNWNRLGFDRQDHLAEPHVWITTVVNNRADRVPRSRVFAEMLVHELAADRHFLIGSNLKGLQGFLWTAFDQMLEGLSLWGDDSRTARPHATDVLQQMAHRFRQPTGGPHVQATLAAMLQGVRNADDESLDEYQRAVVLSVWQDPAAVARELTRAGAENDSVQGVVKHLKWSLKALSEYRKLADRIRVANVQQHVQIEREFQATLRTWFDRKLVVIENYSASGENIIETIAEHTPPGIVNRVMGLQNIKGTGLDFVYRWQTWEKCHEACQLLEETRPALAERGLELLREIQEFGILCDEQLRSTLATLKASPMAQRERFLAELDSVLLRRKHSQQPSVSRAAQLTRWKRITQHCLKMVEQLVEVSDAVRRRKIADQIYRDLADERISGERAILELRALNQRQSSGWLTQKLRTRSFVLPIATLTPTLDSPSSEEATAQSPSQHSETPARQ
jgi:poly-gamma-glutamate synthase PgsB/CapB